MIEARSLSRSYGDLAAAIDVSFAIDSGVVGLLGHNGAGKTTVMKMLSGFLEPSSGHAFLAGIDVAEQPVQAQAHLGYLPEQPPLYDEMTVLDSVRFAAGLRGIDDTASLRLALERTELIERAGSRVGTLSRGYRQRVGVAQAIVHSPAILILDEPTNGLDPTQTEQMRALIRELAERTVVVLSTHILQEVEAVCDRALIMRAGELVLDSELAELQQGERLRVRTSRDTPLAELSALPGVKSVSSVFDGGCWLYTEPDLDAVAAGLASAFAARGWPLYELSAERRSLEAVFRDASEGGA